MYDKHCTISWTTAYSDLLRLKKEHLGSFALAEQKNDAESSEDKIHTATCMGGILLLQFVIGVQNTILLNCFTELLMILEKIRNKAMTGAVRIIVSDKVGQFVSHSWERNVWKSKMKIQPSLLKKNKNKEKKLKPIRDHVIVCGDVCRTF